MIKRSLTVTALILGLGLVLGAGIYLNTDQSLAQTPVKKVERVAPEMKEIPMICTKADLAQWQANLPLGPKGEFPYESSCKNCWLQLGAMRLPSMSVWITNQGKANAPATKAKLTWDSAKAPYGKESITADVPALEAGKNHFLTVTVPQDKFFQTAKPITLELDSQNAVEECNESNTLTYTY